MNLARVEGEPTGVLYSVNFNQDCTSLLVGTKNGFTLYSLANVDKLEPIYYCAGEDVCIVERLFSSSLLAVVNLSSPRKLKVCHFKKGTEICNYSYPNSILSIRLNRMRLVVCLEDSLYIHNIKDMKVIHMIKDTPKNHNGLCALSPNSDNSYLAYPGSCQNGEIQIFDTLNLRAVTMISAHQSPCVAFAFNVSGTKLSSASEKGTVIRVYSVPDGQRLFVFRRGVKRCVSINSLAFSHDSMLLCASSNTETVHVFKLEEQEEAAQEEPAGWMGYFGRALMSSTNYLPSQVADVFTQGRSFATVRLPNPGLRNICALSIINKTLRLLVACADGYLYIYDVPSNEQGGNCNLVKQHRLIGKDEMEDALESKSASTSEPDAIKPDDVKPIAKEGSPPTESAPSSVGKVDSEDSKDLADAAAAAGELKLSESPNKIDVSEAVAD